jgi:glycogen synthase
MPSVWEETAGLSAIEQMMRGRLVIASRIAGLGEMVGDAGSRFFPETRKTWRAACERCCRTRPRWKRLGLRHGAAHCPYS